MKKLDIKVIALDIYGTVLCSDDADGEMPPRKGLKAFFDKCEEKDIKVVSASDAGINDVKYDLKSAGVAIDRFDKFFKLDHYPVKDFMIITRDYGITPRNILIIGDSYKDIGGATKVGAYYVHVPEYRGTRDDFNLGNIKF